MFQIAYVIVKAANSPRPGNWILERSLDGVDYQPWQYYAITDTECLTRYNIHPRPGPPSYAKDDEVICTSYYSKVHPLENGEVRWGLYCCHHPGRKIILFTWQVHALCWHWMLLYAWGMLNSLFYVSASVEVAIHLIKHRDAYTDIIDK